jgi:hypothetical protein
LGDITDGMLRQYIKKGLLTRSVPEGRSQGFYKREQVDTLARKIDNFYPEPDKPGAEFKQLERDEIPEFVSFIDEVFHGTGKSLPRRYRWYDKNPETTFIARDKGKIVGSVCLLPLTQNKLEEVMSQQDTGSTKLIDAEDIETYQAGVPVRLYVLSMGTKLGTSRAVKRARGATLIRGLAHFLTSLGKRGVPVELIAGRSDTIDGIRLLRSVGFTEIKPTGKVRNFVVRVNESGIPLLSGYQASFEAYQKEQ